LNTNELEIKQRAERGMTFLILTYIFDMATEKRNFYGEKRVPILAKIQDSDFCQKYDIFVRFFYRRSAKSRRTAKGPTVLSNLLNMLTIRINLRKIYFLNNLFFFRKI